VAVSSNIASYPREEMATETMANEDFDEFKHTEDEVD
jgi:hypothetical protein